MNLVFRCYLWQKGLFSAFNNRVKSIIMQVRNNLFTHIVIISVNKVCDTVSILDICFQKLK